MALAARARDRLAAVNAALGFSYPASFGSVCRMSETLPRLVRYLVATPRTLVTELRALDVQSQRMGDRFFTEADAAALCMARWARAPSSLPRPTPRGSATLDGYMSEFDTSQGLTGTSWAYDFWDPDTNAWHDTPGRRGLQHIHLSFWEEPIVGRDGSGSGSNAVRLFDQAADILVVFSVGTHAGTVFTAGNGVAGFLPTLRAVLGGGAPPSRRP